MGTKTFRVDMEEEDISRGGHQKPQSDNVRMLLVCFKKNVLIFLYLNLGALTLVKALQN